MGVQLNIKDAETVRLARLLADQSGRTVTAIIRDALVREARAREDEVAAKIRDVQDLLKGSRQLWKEEWSNKTSKEIMDSLYDEDGLPK